MFERGEIPIKDEGTHSNHNRQKKNLKKIKETPQNDENYTFPEYLEYRGKFLKQKFTKVYKNIYHQ